MIWAIVILLVGIGVWAALRWYANADPALVKRGLAGFVLLFLALITIILLVTGRASAALPFLFGAFFAYQRLRTGLGFAQFLKRLWDVTRGKTDHSKSEIETAYLRMTLDKSSGALAGKVLQGAFAGQSLAALSETELLAKYQELRRLDYESARLLETFVDKRLGATWRSKMPPGGDDETPGKAQGSAMSLERAADVLGVEAMADRDTIIKAYKRLMKVAHPDQGGSDFLAGEINAAKDVLLKSHD